MKIKVAFYKGGEGWQHKIIRWWTRSIYSHAELVMPDNFTWISISPFLESKVSKRLKTDFDLEKWDFVTVDITEEQHSALMEFYENTKDNVYDWWVCYYHNLLLLRLNQKINGIVVSGLRMH